MEIYCKFLFAGEAKKKERTITVFSKIWAKELNMSQVRSEFRNRTSLPGDNSLYVDLTICTSA
jgi:hypothetical protein